MLSNEKKWNCTKVPIKEIVFQWSESRVIGNKPVKVQSIKSANNILFAIAQSAPRDGSYHKTKVDIVWKDGTKYSERFDVQHSTIDTNWSTCNIADTIQSTERSVKSPRLKNYVKPEDIAFMEKIVKNYDIHGECEK